MASPAVIVVTIEGQNGDKHVLKISPSLWEQDSPGVMQKLHEAIDGIAGLPRRYDRQYWHHTLSAEGEEEIRPDI